METNQTSLFYLTTLIITAFIEHAGGEWCFSKGRPPPQILMISDSFCFQFIYFYSGYSNLWNRFSIPNASESKNRLFLESVPSPITITGLTINHD